MKEASDTRKVAGIADAAVQARTGKTWKEWFALLDQAGARQLDHKGIVAILSKQHGMGGWWQQMVAVAYEQARGLREKHQKPEGYQISGSKTVDAPVAKLFAAWHDPKARARWLKEAKLVIRKATEIKSLRITWVDGKTSLDVNIYPKGGGKCQVAVQHSKLPDAQQAEMMKAYWGEQLDRLETFLQAS